MNNPIFTSTGLHKAQQIISSIPPSHRNLLVQSSRSTNSSPRRPVGDASQQEKR